MTVTDRRAVRTNRALREALVRLLRRKSYDDITVRDIVGEADIGRSTFYMHCTGKEDLLRRGLQALRAELSTAQMRASRPSKTRLAFSSRLLQHVDEHRDIYPALGRSRGRDVLIRELRQVALALARDDLDAMPLDESLPRDVLEQHVVGAFMSILVWWLECRPRYSPAEIDAMYQKLVIRGVAARRA